MSDHRLLKRIVCEELDKGGQRKPGGRRKHGRTACQMIVGFFRITGDPGAWYNISCRKCVKEEEKPPENRQRKRDAEEADKIDVAPGTIIGGLRRFRAALIGRTPGLSETASAAPMRKPENP